MAGATGDGRLKYGTRLRIPTMNAKSSTRNL